MLNSTDIKLWLTERSLKERNKLAKKILLDRYGSIHKGLEAILETNLPRNKDAQTGHNFIAVYKNDDPTNSFGLKDKTTHQYNSSFRGDILSCIGFFFGADKDNRSFEGSNIFSEFFNIPTWLIGPKCRDKALEFLISKYGTLRSAGESLSNMTLYNCPKKTGESWDTTNGYRLLEDDDSFAVIHLINGNCAPKANFFANLGAVLGYQDKYADEKGWELVFDDVIGSPSNITIDPEASARAKASAKERERKAIEKSQTALERAQDILSQAETGLKAREIYASYLTHDRGVKGITADDLSDNILLVESLKYYNIQDKENHKKCFTSIILPLVKRGEIHGLHVIHLEETDGKWRKANIETAKKDLTAWSTEQGSSCAIAHHEGAKSLYIGEGNENVSSYLGAIKSRTGFKPPHDFKCTNTATRLSGYDSSNDNYESYNILVDRDFSGAGMRHSMIKREQLLKEGKEVTLIVPPSVKLPIFIYANEDNEALTLSKCFDEADYWNAMDYVFSEKARLEGRSYKSRYKSLVVVNEKQMSKLSDTQKASAILNSELHKDDYPKGVDWSDIIAVNSELAFELADMYDRLIQESA